MRQAHLRSHKRRVGEAVRRARSTGCGARAEGRHCPGCWPVPNGQGIPRPFPGCRKNGHSRVAANPGIDLAGPKSGLWKSVNGSRYCSPPAISVCENVYLIRTWCPFTNRAPATSSPRRSASRTSCSSGSCDCNPASNCFFKSSGSWRIASSQTGAGSTAVFL